MPVYTDTYEYGADADGNRGIMVTDVIVESDISGKELDSDDIYDCDDGLCSYDELIEWLGAKFLTADKELTCVCDEKIEEGDEIVEVDGQYYHEDCFNDWIEDEFHIDVETAYDRHYYSYEDYLEDQADRYRDDY